MLDNGASKIILMSHLGRPKGTPNSKYSLAPIAKYLSEQLNINIVLTESATDHSIKQLINLSETKVVLLENLRFSSKEEANDHDFAKILASYADIYVNDAFGTAHRKHASTYEINKFFKNCAYGGFLLKNEVEALQKIVNSPDRPFYAIVGGAKVSDKIKIIKSLLGNVDKLIIGGAMSYPFLSAKGHEIGKSLCSPEDIKLATEILNAKGGDKVILPCDHIVSTKFGGAPELIESYDIPKDKMGLDIGPQSIKKFQYCLADAKTILWNGPMGLFENSDFAKGTLAIAETLAKSEAFTLVGGGDSVSAITNSGLADKISHVSTGGGASLEFIENGTLPGIQALKFGL